MIDYTDLTHKTVDFPALPGGYALRMHLPEDMRLQIGRLGMFDFPAGEYIYCGSAHGPGGLQGRLSHHLRIASRPHWHLDWLRPHVEIMGVWFAVEGELQGSQECTWAQRLARLPGAVIPAPGFGSADCQLGCKAHLIYIVDTEIAFVVGI